MAIKAGTPSDLGDSMALAIKEAFKSHFKEVMKTDKDAPDSKEMTLLFVAVAEGVIKHLKAQQNSFKVKTSFDSKTYDGTVEIETTP